MGDVKMQLKIAQSIIT